MDGQGHGNNSKKFFMDEHGHGNIYGHGNNSYEKDQNCNNCSNIGHSRSECTVHRRGVCTVKEIMKQRMMRVSRIGTKKRS